MRANILKLGRIALVAAGTLLLTACATQFRSEVQTFHKMQAPAGETFRVVPTDPAKTGSLEFESYANLVRGEMVKLGYKPVNAANAADLDVKIDYSISDPVEKVDTRPAAFSSSLAFGYGPYWGPYYGGYGYNRSGFGHRGYYGNGFGYYDPFWGPGFGSSFWGPEEVYSYSVYTRKLNMSIARGGKEIEQLFEGKVSSAGRDNRLPEIMPYMVQSLFREFPGQSGITRRVTIEIPNK
jgi:hypothetical protein